MKRKQFQLRKSKSYAKKDKVAKSKDIVHLKLMKHCVSTILQEKKFL